MITSEVFANRREGAVGKLAAQVHRYLPAESDALRAFFGFEISKWYVKEVGDGLLDDLDSWPLILSADKVVQSLPCEFDRNTRPAH